MDRKIYWVTEDRLSEIFEVTGRQIRDVCLLAKNKDKNSQYKGKYDFVHSIKLYLNNVKTEKGDYLTQIKRIDKEYKELKLELLKGKVVNVDEMKILVGDMLIKFKSKLQEVPCKLSAVLMNRENRSDIEEILRREIELILNELTEIDLVEDDSDEES